MEFVPPIDHRPRSQALGGIRGDDLRRRRRSHTLIVNADQVAEEHRERIAARLVTEGIYPDAGVGRPGCSGRTRRKRDVRQVDVRLLAPDEVLAAAWALSRALARCAAALPSVS